MNPKGGFTKKQSVAIVGAGPAGCACAYFSDKSKNEVTLFDFARPLHTLLYTGGGRCNLAYAEYDFKELAKFYPRGEKFLYSVFSKFATADTIDFFQNIWVDVYTQDDMRIFPVSNSAQETREAVLNAIKGCKIKREKVLRIEVKQATNCHPAFIAGSENVKADRSRIEVRDDNNAQDNCGFSFVTDCGSYNFDKVVISVGGRSGFALAQNLGHKIIEPKPALVGLISLQKLKSLQGVSLKNVSAAVYFENKKVAQATDDLIFTQSGISGPLAYKISSVCARLDFNIQKPLKIYLDFVGDDFENFKVKFQDMLNLNPKKDIKNLVSEFVPKSFSEYMLNANKIALDEKCCNINAKTRDLIVKSLCEFEITITSPAKEGEVVTSGGVSLDEINPKDMQSKIIDGLYFCGEVIDVDGFCGGFNLQNCWSTGFVAGTSL